MLNCLSAAEHWPVLIVAGSIIYSILSSPTSHKEQSQNRQATVFMYIYILYYVFFLYHKKCRHRVLCGAMQWRHWSECSSHALLTQFFLDDLGYLITLGNIQKRNLHVYIRSEWRSFICRCSATSSLYHMRCTCICWQKFSIRVTVTYTRMYWLYTPGSYQLLKPLDQRQNPSNPSLVVITLLAGTSHGPRGRSVAN